MTGAEGSQGSEAPAQGETMFMQSQGEALGHPQPLPPPGVRREASGVSEDDHTTHDEREEVIDSLEQGSSDAQQKQGAKPGGEMPEATLTLFSSATTTVTVVAPCPSSAPAPAPAPAPASTTALAAVTVVAITEATVTAASSLGGAAPGDGPPFLQEEFVGDMQQEEDRDEAAERRKKKRSSKAISVRSEDGKGTRRRKKKKKGKKQDSAHQAEPEAPARQGSFQKDRDAETKGRVSMIRQLSSRKQTEEMLIGTKVDEKHKNYVLMYVMLLGIRTSLSRCHAKQSRPLSDEDFSAAHKIAFDITGHEMTPSSKYDFKFKDYSPWVFRNLRERFQLDAADYLVSLTGRYVLSELGTPGKSGSFFYFSQDYRFIIKTISHTEHKFFLKILRQYYKYIMENPNTLISRFYGLHRVKLSRGSKIHFVVMGNVFPPNKDIHETYDLKGSTHGRYVEMKPGDSGEYKSKILKDLNFSRKIVLGPLKQKLFVEQIQKDAEFLASQNIMDYSMLLGIHNLDRGNAEQLRDRELTVFEPPSSKKKNTMSREQRKAMKKAISLAGPVSLDSSKTKLPDNLPKERIQSVFYQDEGGFRSTDEHNRPLQEIYHMGIIDILTPYNTVKKIEHALLSINHDPLAVSCIEPSLYSKRFANFLVNGTTEHSKKKRRAGRGDTEGEERGISRQTSSVSA